MAIDGKIHIIPNPQTQSWDVYVENSGDKKFGITHNVFANAASERTVHDDHRTYGHGLPVTPGTVTHQAFRSDTPYNGQKITDQSVIRLGIRGHASITVPLPPLNSGEVATVSVDDFNWYNGDKFTANGGTERNYTGGQSGSTMDEWNAQARVKVSTGIDPSQLREMLAKMSGGSKDIECKGSVEVRAVRRKGKVHHWVVRFDNDGKTAFMGTAAFAGSSGKNAGIGLESMPVPKKGAAAEQIIEANGDYGVTAQAGAELRLGVRGYGLVVLALPESGKASAEIETFERSTSQASPDFFDAKLVREKRNEKVGRVQFFQDDECINDRLKPIRYTGDDALARSTYDPPTVVVESVEPSDDLPSGGWRVYVGNSLPASDEHGHLNLTTELKLGDGGRDKKRLPNQRLQYGGAAEYQIARSAIIGGVKARSRTRLLIKLPGTGWTASIPLPKAGTTTQAAPGDDHWWFREDLYNRSALDPE